MPIRLLSYSILFFLIGVGPAYAYLDPGSVSMFLQAIAAAGVGAILYFGGLWRKLTSCFRWALKPLRNINSKPSGDDVPGEVLSGTIASSKSDHDER